MRFLVDTNVISEVRHPKGSRVVKRRFRELDTETVFTSVVVFGELTKGVRSLPKGRRKTGLEVWLGQFESGFGDRILPIDPQVAKVWGELMADGMIYCLGHRGAVSLLKITPGGFDIVSKFELPKKPSNHYLAHPVVCGGRLYLRGHQILYVYDIRAREGG